MKGNEQISKSSKQSLLKRLNRNTNVLRSRVINSTPEIELQLKRNKHSFDAAKGVIQMNHGKCFKRKMPQPNHAFNSYRNVCKAENGAIIKANSSRKKDILNKINYLNKELDKLDIDKPPVKYDLKK